MTQISGRRVVAGNAMMLAAMVALASAVAASIDPFRGSVGAGSCSGSASIGDPDAKCNFDCSPNQDVTVSGAGTVFISVAGSCGGASAGCHDSNLGPTTCPQDSPHPTSSNGRGTCTAFGAGTFSCSAA